MLMVGLGSDLYAEEITLSENLKKISEKVDTDGEFFEVNYHKEDVEKIIEYGDDLIDVISLYSHELKFLKNINLAEVMDESGVTDSIASGRSDKKVHGLWVNKSFFLTNGKMRGLNSLFGNVNDKFAVLDYAPETTDIAVQGRLDLRQLKNLIEMVGAQSGKQEEIDTYLKAELPELAGMSIMNVIEKTNIRISAIVDLDEKEKLDIDGVPVSRPEFLVRVDNAKWIWDLVEKPFIEATELPWRKNTVGDVTTYSLPDSQKEYMEGYSPIIRIDKKFVWLASSPKIIESAISAAPKLRDESNYRRAAKGLPKDGNMIAYVSPDFQKEISKLYKLVSALEEVKNDDFALIAPLLSKAVTDMTDSKQGLLAMMDVQEDGMYTVVRSPLPFKDYWMVLVNAITVPIMEATKGKF